MLVGARPEHLRLAAPAHPRDRAAGPLWRGVVRLVENLGGEEVAHVAVGGHDEPGTRIAVRGPRPLGLAVGDAVALTCDPDRVHLFDAAGGRRLVRAAAPTSAAPAA